MNFKNNSFITTTLLKILGISILLIFGITLVVRGENLDLKSVKIVFDNGSEINVVTTKSTVAQILSENHILLLDNETTTPKLDENLESNNKIVISKADNIVESSEIIENNIDLNTLEQNYLIITEKILTITEEIPFETIQKDISDNANDTTNKVIQEGQNGLKETKYKVKYQGDIEISREEISSKIIKEPINRIVQITAKQVASSRSSITRTSSSTLANKVEGITPKVATFNTSAYCSCAKCCGKSTGITASGARASSWYTLAAGKRYKFGTIIYIPALKNKPNGGWFVVQDRGGAISNNRLDVYMGSHSEALKFGRKSLQCYIYEV